ncbi:hypothetical protein T07_12042 [Trichinella nelsoni]|uniref:Uncharacterized protein n=1 Tax=Trichinella nelsoni TaxID=6336 RepID=A0A0V0RBR9_9BILA|nr:hypothetical protein T07_12042 [Trichinella nelsoni]
MRAPLRSRALICTSVYEYKICDMIGHKFRGIA